MRSIPRIVRRALGALAVFVIALPAVASCGATTSTTELWQADYPVSPMRRILVFGGGMGETERRTLEDHIAGELGAHGVAAIPSYQIFPEYPDTKSARGEVQRRGYDGALVAKVESVREHSTYAPSYYSAGFWGGYYSPGWGMGWSPGYVVTDTIADVETSLWDLRRDTGVLVWSATTRTENLSSNRDFVESLTREILPKIEHTGLIPEKR